MHAPIGSSQRVVLTILSLLGLFALGAQFYLFIQNRQASLPETIIRFFSYFTILTNILVFVSSAVLTVSANSRTARFFAAPSVRTAIAVYITIVGIIYNAILASQWNPTGLQRVVDQLLHTVIPVMYVVCWITYVRRFRLAWKAMLRWMIYPLVYCVYTLLRGPLASWYPYPFIDVEKLGYTQVLTNIVGVVLAFLFVSGIFIAATRIHEAPEKDQ